MKSGATFLIGIASDIDDIEKVESVIFTIRGKEELQKNYPNDVAFDENHNFLIPLTQEETTLLAGQYGHKVLVEGQVNFADKSVNKTATAEFFIGGTLATEIIEGNTPSAYPITEISLKFMDGIVVADLDPDAFDEKIEKKVEELTACMQEEIDSKVSKVDGKSLIADSEIKRLANVDNYDDTEIREELSNKIDASVLTDYSLIADTGYELGLNIDAKTYVMTISLKNKYGNVLSTKNIDFPIESMVVGASYDKGVLHLTLQSGQTLDVDISAIVSGLVNDSFTIAGIDMKDNITSSELKVALGLTKEDVGLGNVDNTSDADKPISTAMQKALNDKVEKVNGKSLILDSEIERLASVHNYDDTEIKAEIDEKADKSEVEIASTSTTSPITDSANGYIRDFEAFGKCEQGENPSPDSPQEIKAWDGTIVTHGKNLLSDDILTVFGGKYVSTGDNKIYVKPNTTYAFSVAYSNGVDGVITIHAEDDSVIETKRQGANNKESILIATQPNASYIKISRWCVDSSDVTLDKAKPMLEENDHVTEYQPYSESSADLGISLYGIKVPSYGNYTDSDGQQWLCDKIDMSKGVIERYLDYKQVPNNLTWSIQNQSGYSLGFNNGFMNNCKSTQASDDIMWMSNMGKSSRTWRNGFYFGRSNVFWIVPYANESLTSEEINEWLTEHPMYLLAPLENPTTEPLTEAQINALRGLQTYSDATYVEYGGLEPFAEIGYWLNNKNAQSVADVDAKIPFSFGVEDGVYGYYTGRGADTFHPFSSGGSSKPTYLIVNQGNGINVLDFSDFSETHYTNSEMMSGIVQIAPSFHVVFNTIQRNCLTLVSDDKISVSWRRSSSYPKEDIELASGENHLLWGAAETNGYAIVVCN